MTGLHKHIRIEGNIIEGGNAENGIAFSGAEDLAIRYNEFVGYKNSVYVAHSEHVDVYANAGVSDFKE